MKKQTIFSMWTTGLLFFVLANATRAEKPQPVAVPGNIQWVYSYAQGQQLARETGKPMLVVFRCER